jgi:pyruvate kinase
MANPFSTQDDAAVNYHTDSAANTSGSTAPGAHPAAAVTFVSGTAKVVDSKVDTFLYINIATSAALAIAFGPTSAVANAISPSQSSAIGMLTVFVPAGWYVKLTGTMANLSCIKVAV